MSAKSEEMLEVENPSFSNSTRTLVKKNWKKRLSNDLWWKITITLAVIVIAAFIIYKAVDDDNKAATNANLSSNPKGQKTNSERTPVTTTDEEADPEGDLACRKGSIENSNAAFTFQPASSEKPYTTNGVEFSFEVILRKPGVKSGLKELSEVKTATSRIHYYYNIPRCRIGGGLQLHKQPYVRGPIVFAVDQQCSKVYYFTEDKGWTQYISARNISCSAHGNEGIHVEESVCLQGSVKNSNSSFLYMPFGNTKPFRASGVEFSFEMLRKKTKLGSTLTRLNKLLASTSEIHYYYNIPRCRIGGGLQLDKEPYVRGPIVFAVDQQCSKVYYFTEGKGWTQYLSTKDLKCSSHGKNNETRCFKGSFDGAYSTFMFKTSTGDVNVTGIQYNFTKLVGKLQSLITDLNLTRISELTSNGNDVLYYLNLQRCYNGGPVDMNTTPQIRGPIIFAISDKCSIVYYLSSSSSENSTSTLTQNRGSTFLDIF